jgi:hypothetical protein
MADAQPPASLPRRIRWVAGRFKVMKGDVLGRFVLLAHAVRARDAFEAAHDDAAAVPADLFGSPTAPKKEAVEALRAAALAPPPAAAAAAEAPAPKRPRKIVEAAVAGATATGDVATAGAGARSRRHSRSAAAAAPASEPAAHTSDLAALLGSF